MFECFLSFLCFLGVDVSVDHSSGRVRGVYDGVRNLICVAGVTWQCSRICHLHWNNRTWYDCIYNVAVYMHACAMVVVRWWVGVGGRVNLLKDTWYMTNVGWVMCVISITGLLNRILSCYWTIRNIRPSNVYLFAIVRGKRGDFRARLDTCISGPSQLGQTLVSVVHHIYKGATINLFCPSDKYKYYVYKYCACVWLQYPQVQCVCTCSGEIWAFSFWY